MIGRTTFGAFGKCPRIAALVLALMMGLGTGAHAQYTRESVQRRDDALRRLLDSPGDRNLFVELNRLNGMLQDSSHTVQVFDRLLAEHPAAARNHWSSSAMPGMATRVAVEARRLDLLRQIETDLVQEFEWERRLYQTSTEAAQRRGDPAAAARASSVMGRHLVEYSLLLIESALALGQEDDARTIQQRALAVMPDQRLRDAIPLTSARQAH
jgi:hypothetical protein